MNQLSGLTSLLPTSTEEMTWGETPSLRSKPFELWCHFCLPGHKIFRFSSKGPFLFSWELSVFLMWEKLRKHHLQNEVLHLEAGWNFLRHVSALVALLVEIQIFDVVHRYTPNTLLNKDTFCETITIYIPSGRFTNTIVGIQVKFWILCCFFVLGPFKKMPKCHHHSTVPRCRSSGGWTAKTSSSQGCWHFNLPLSQLVNLMCTIVYY